MEEAAGPAHVAFDVPAPPDLPHPVLAPADPPLVLDAIFASEPCEPPEAAGLARSEPSDTLPQAVSQGDAPAPHPAQGTDPPAPLDSAPGQGKTCTVKNDMRVAVEVRLNEDDEEREWHVLYPEQIKIIEYDAALDQEVSVRLRENYDIQGKMCINDISGFLSIPQHSGHAFDCGVNMFINNQVKEANEERRLADERQRAITTKVNDAINLAAHRRQGCFYLCTAISMSVLLGSLIVCTNASLKLDYEAPEQYGLGAALVLLLYCACIAPNGFIGAETRTGKGSLSIKSHRIQTRRHQGVWPGFGS
eukprot:Skav223270  [mRNA]  locus=scaffold3424:85322:86239:+ [translate_table: standard]